MCLAYEGRADIQALGEKLKPVIFGLMTPFTRNRALMAIEDRDSLLNLCLSKLYQAAIDFKYDHSLTEAHNDGRFVNLAKTYIKNILIDNVYKLNLRSRKPAKPIYSINQPPPEYDDDTFEYCVDRSLPVDVQVERNDVHNRLLSGFTGKDREAVILLSEGHNPGTVAARVGLETSYVRRLLSQRVQPKLKKILKIND